MEGGMGDDRTLPPRCVHQRIRKSTDLTRPATGLATRLLLLFLLRRHCVGSSEASRRIAGSPPSSTSPLYSSTSHADCNLVAHPRPRPRALWLLRSSPPGGRHQHLQGLRRLLEPLRLRVHPRQQWLDLRGRRQSVLPQALSGRHRRGPGRARPQLHAVQVDDAGAGRCAVRVMLCILRGVYTVCCVLCVVCCALCVVCGAVCGAVRCVLPCAVCRVPCAVCSV